MPLWLVRLYPPSWRRRYGAEFTDVIRDLTRDGRPGRRRSGLALALDIIAGALDAHLVRSHAMRTFPSDPALRRGLYGGLLVAAVIAVGIVLTNVVFPASLGDSDGDQYLAGGVGAILAMIMLLVGIGSRGRRRSGSPAGGPKAGAMAGFVIAFLTQASFFAIDNLFLGIVGRQHDKAVGFATSGWTSMRAYVNDGLLVGSAFVIPAVTVTGAVLGLLGGMLARERRAPTT